jgi:hypothetical protein
MRKVIGKVVCKENTGFAPRRFISENTHQIKLMQHYLETNNEAGMFVFLDSRESLRQGELEIYEESSRATGIRTGLPKVDTNTI